MENDVYSKMYGKMCSNTGNDTDSNTKSVVRVEVKKTVTAFVDVTVDTGRSKEETTARACLKLANSNILLEQDAYGGDTSEFEIDFTSVLDWEIEDV